MNDTFMWWGYLHEAGTIQAKRYFEKRDIMEAMESPFCKEVFGPFQAKNREHAIEIIQETLRRKYETNNLSNK